MYAKSRLASNECFPWPRVDLSASISMGLGTSKYARRRQKKCKKDRSEIPNVLWNRLATPQDTHDQESNAPSAPLAKCTRFGCARDWEDKQQWLAGEAPSATARFYSNGRNSYSCLVPCARRPSKMQAALLPCSVHFVRCFVSVSKSSRTFVQTFWNCLVLLVRFGET